MNRIPALARGYPSPSLEPTRASTTKDFSKGPECPQSSPWFSGQSKTKEDMKLVVASLRAKDNGSMEDYPLEGISVDLPSLDGKLFANEGLPLRRKLVDLFLEKITRRRVTLPWGLPSTYFSGRAHHTFVFFRNRSNPAPCSDRSFLIRYQRWEDDLRIEGAQAESMTEGLC